MSISCPSSGSSISGLAISGAAVSPKSAYIRVLGFEAHIGDDDSSLRNFSSPKLSGFVPPRFDVIGEGDCGDNYKRKRRRVDEVYHDHPSVAEVEAWMDQQKSYVARKPADVAALRFMGCQFQNPSDSVSNSFALPNEAGGVLLNRHYHTRAHDVETFERRLYEWAGAPLVEDLRSAGSITGRSIKSNDGTQVDEQGPVANWEASPFRLSAVDLFTACRLHRDQSIQACPRECTWQLEQNNERVAGLEDVELTHISPSSSMAGRRASTTPATLHPFRTFDARNQTLLPIHIKTCHILIVLGTITIIGSLTGALWRTEALDDASGGFALGQYFLGVGALVVGCFTAVHVKYCRCWETGVRT